MRIKYWKNDSSKINQESATMVEAEETRSAKITVGLKTAIKITQLGSACFIFPQFFTYVKTNFIDVLFSINFVHNYNQTKSEATIF